MTTRQPIHVEPSEHPIPTISTKLFLVSIKV